MPQMQGDAGLLVARCQGVNRLNGGVIGNPGLGEFDKNMLRVFFGRMSTKVFKPLLIE